MKNSNKIFCLTLLMVCMVFGTVRAEKVKGVRRSSSPKAESATCLPASNSNELSVNNVRAYIETGGTMWFKEVAEYEVPKGSGKTSMFSAALWIGGLDANGQLKLAAVRFRQVGDDYWTGPLKITGAGTTQSECMPSCRSQGCFPYQRAYRCRHRRRYRYHQGLRFHDR